MRGNTIEIKFLEKRGKMAKTIPLYQYDYGQRLIITDLELPTSYEIHFANEMHGESVLEVGDSTGIDIPDSLLETGKNIYLWLFLHDGEDDGETEYSGVIPVIKRAERSEDEPTPEQQGAITTAIAALNAAVEATGADATATAADAISTAADALASEGYALGKQNGVDVDSSSPYYHKNSKYYASNASTYANNALTAKTGAETAQAAAESWATGGSSGTPSATNNAKYYSEQAASSATSAGTAKTGAETAQGKAETAQGKAEAWATGGSSGTPSATNNAKYYSEQAAASATAAASIIDDTAGDGDTDKTWSADKLVDELAEKYDTPSDGIPSTDMSSAVQTSLGKADSAYQKPSGGIPATDIADGVIPVVTGKADKVASATNGNFAALDENGNLKDSGHKHGDYLTSHQDISGKANKADTVLTTTLSRGRKENTTSGTGSMAFGYNAEASGDYSVATGSATKASGASSFAEGFGTTASGSCSHAENNATLAGGSNSHADGYHTVAGKKNQHVFGRWNVVETGDATAEGTYVEIVGNGTEFGSESNARTLDWSGNEALAGDLTINKGTVNEKTVGTELSALNGAIGVSQPTAQNSDVGKFLKLKTIDANGKPTAFEYGEGGGGSEIDDTAGAGVTNKTWSANKLTTMIGDIETLLAAI